MKTLLVEDQPEVRMLLEKQISLLGHEVTACATAKAALETFQLSLYALVVLDLGLPDIDGLELCRRLRALPQGMLCMILIVTARDAAEDLQAALDAGADDYLIKPVAMDVLKVRLTIIERELQKLLQRNQAWKSLKQSLNQIEQAKQEWEATADSLSSLICLLDSRGYIVRVNRTIEHWNLGKVVGVKGQAIHKLFHPQCTEPNCYLKMFLQQAWQEIARGKPLECEIEDSRLQRQLHLQVRPISEYTGKQIDKSASFAVLTVNDITERKQTESALQQQKKLLNGVAEAMNSLLIETNYQTGIHKAVESLGMATDVDRVSIFRTHPHPADGEPAMSQFCEWTRDIGIAKTPNPDLQNLLYSHGFSRWHERLSHHKTIFGVVRNFPPAEREMLQAQNIFSLILVPIIIRDEFWGFIGFDDFHTDRRWREEEEAILMAAATSIGGAIARYQAEEQLQRTSSELRAIFQSLPDEYFRLNANRSILDYKIDQGTDLYLSDTFIGKWASGMLPENVERQFDETITQVLQTKTLATIEYRLMSAEEKPYHAEVRVLPFLEDQLLVVVRDMTDWKIAEKAASGS